MKNFARASLGIAFSILTGSAVFSLNTLAGGWVSGGGEFITDQHNPWFLENTKTVKYCVDIDEKNFGLSRIEVEAAVLDAINYWKSQLAKVESWTKVKNFSLKLGTQDYMKTTCNDSPDIKFQFGVLSSEQIAKIPEARKYVGFAIRTEYDPVNMKGAGFIYIAPEKGPLSLEFKSTDNKTPWSGPNGTYRLQTVLVHELGHTFGIPHNRDVFVMREDFPSFSLESTNYIYTLPTNLLNPDLVPQKNPNLGCSWLGDTRSNVLNKFDAQRKTLKSRKKTTLNKSDSNHLTGESSAFAQFFGLKMNCYDFKSVRPNELSMFEWNLGDQHYREVGAIVVDEKSDKEAVVIDSYELSTVYTSEKSILYDPGFEIRRFNIPTTWLLTQKIVNAVYVNHDTHERTPIKLTIHLNGDKTFSVTYKNKIYVNLRSGY